jgi:hypothetical protein
VFTLLGGCLIALLGACQSSSTVPEEPANQPAAENGDELEGWNVASGEAGLYQLAWRPVEGSVPRNEDFELEVVLRRDGRPLPGMRLAVSGWMPAHGHGLVREPVVTDLGDGRFAVEGVLLHMRGLWELVFNVTDGVSADSVRFELQL